MVSPVLVPPIIFVPKAPAPSSGGSRGATQTPIQPQAPTRTEQPREPYTPTPWSDGETFGVLMLFALLFAVLVSMIHYKPE